MFGSTYSADANVCAHTPSKRQCSPMYRLPPSDAVHLVKSSALRFRYAGGTALLS